MIGDEKMTETICACDRCGVKISDRNFILIEKKITYRVIVYDHKVIGNKGIDLCDKCMNDFKQWMGNDGN